MSCDHGKECIHEYTDFFPPLSWFDYFVTKNGNLNFEFPGLSRHSMIIKDISLHPTF